MATTQELEVADWVAALVMELYEIEVGPATERDGKDDSGLTVDFTYEEADPRIAVGGQALRSTQRALGGGGCQGLHRSCD